MERVLTTELAAHAGERVRLQGWLHRQRRLSRVSFLVLRDRAGLAQVNNTRTAAAAPPRGVWIMASSPNVPAPASPAGIGREFVDRTVRRKRVVSSGAGVQAESCAPPSAGATDATVVSNSFTSGANQKVYRTLTSRERPLPRRTLPRAGPIVVTPKPQPRRNR